MVNPSKAHFNGEAQKNHIHHPGISVPGIRKPIIILLILVALFSISLVFVPEARMNNSNKEGTKVEA